MPYFADITSKAFCGLSGAAPDGLFTAPVNSLNDFRNKSIAATGLSAPVLGGAGHRLRLKRGGRWS